MILIGFALYKNRIASLFENSTELGVYCDKSEKWELVECIGFDVPDAFNKVRILKKANLDILICGAITWEIATLIDKSGISLYPWISGNIDEVLDAFKNGQIDGFIMPGFNKHRKRWGRCWRRVRIN